MLKRLLFLILIIFVAGPVFATGVTLKVAVYDENGVLTHEGQVVEITQPACITSPTAQDYMAVGSLKTQQEVNGGIETVNVNGYISSTINGPNQYLSNGVGGARVRVWNGTSAASVIASQGYYGYLDYDLGTQNATPFDWTVTTMTTHYQAAPPVAPTIGGASLAYTAINGNLVGYATIPVYADTNRYELAHTTDGAMYELQFRPLGGSWVAKTQDSATFTTNSSVPEEQLLLGTTYEVQARCRSYFGTSDWSPVITFDTVGSPVGPTTVSMVLTLESAVPAGPGINFIALPSAPDTNGNWYAPNNTNNKTIKTAYELVLAINEAAGIANPATEQGVVSTFGKWDKSATNQKDVGVLINSKIANNSQADLQGITLKQGEGYQLYVGPLTNNNRLEMLIKNASQ